VEQLCIYVKLLIGQENRLFFPVSFASDSTKKLGSLVLETLGEPFTGPAGKRGDFD
jgi:hypothetical protein